MLLVALGPVSHGSRSLAADREPRQAERLEVDLVQLDVVVTDRKGTPIPGIRPEEFDLIVDNVRRPIAAVDERCAPASEAGTGETSAAGDGDRYLAILFDMSHMLSSSRRSALRATLKFVDREMGRNDKVMILALMRGLFVVSGFTIDREALHAHLERLLTGKDLIDTSALEEESVLQEIYRNRRSAALQPSMRRVPIEGVVEQFGCLSEGRNAEFETARSIRLLANAMPAFGGLPGRKSLVLFTEKLRANPALPFYNACGIPEFEQLSLSLTALPEIQDLSLKANLAGVSFYPVHAGGLSPGATPMGEHSARSFQVDVAKATGGKSFVLMKDALEPFRQALEDSACHYLLSFKPSDGLQPGKHSVHLEVRRKRVRVRYPEYFTSETAEQRSESEMMAVLSNPGMYRDLPVEVHGFSLGERSHGTRWLLLKVSVKASDLILSRSSADRSTGEVTLRGAVISRKRLECKFEKKITLDLEVDGSASEVGLETACDLPVGELEIIVAARDERGGALGAYWGRAQLDHADKGTSAEALLWAPSGWDHWVRMSSAVGLPDGPLPLFVRRDYRLTRGEPASLSLLACREGDGAAETPVVSLKGTATARIPARPLAEVAPGRCGLLEVELPAATLPAGRYEISPEPSAGWSFPGKPVTLVVAEP